MDDIKVFTGKVLRQIREYRGLSCPEIAAKYGISATAIYDYESGRSLPKSTNAEKLSAALRIDWDTFQRIVADSQTEVIFAESSFDPKKGSTPVRTGKYKDRVDPSETARKIIDAGMSAKLVLSDPLLQVVIQSWENLSAEAKGKIITILENDKSRESK